MNKLSSHALADKLASDLQQQLQDQIDWLEPLALLDGIKNRISWQPYHALPELKQTVGRLESDRPELLGVLLQFLLVRLVADFSPDHLSFKVTDEIAELYQQSFARILGQPGPEEADDSYYKDLALASGALFPAGERVVEPFSVLQRSLMFNAGVTQSLQFIKSGLLAGGYKPVFRLHVHLAEQSRLSEQSWRHTCQRLAQMLEVNPGIRGIVGSSWYYDPQVPAISPHLGFVNKLLAENGAYWFFSHIEGSNSGAFATSQTRKQAFETGKYLPRNYVVFWPRNRVLSWYQKVKSDNTEAGV
ncbi:hypothetical protein [Lacimicrobium alkaliphilum]|uniref:Uncharacterized protein n=1 Tax=Lacimicrobium alkaliphilum TaxID=1526571 RepID=A0ABQ1RHX8_9ALTE|nr:hypothetical protein [Lacimicrobium alkaliphilum]GGD68979.1 hypothetical protein GCM10011357_25060 [Lacimicrobium alkaliphilum]